MAATATASMPSETTAAATLEELYAIPPLTNRSSRKKPKHGWDWIETCGIDVLNCDDNCATSRRVLETMMDDESDGDEPGANYAALHDEFIESLLFEQENRPAELPHKTMKTTRAGVLGSARIGGEADSDASVAGINSSISVSSAASSASSTIDYLGDRVFHKRRRPVRMYRRSSPMRTQEEEEPSPASPTADEADPTDTNATVSSSAANKNALTIPFGNPTKKSNCPHPSTFVHPQCRMQKDKGKGEAVGSNICAKGRDACLGKLRAKMELLADHAGGGADLASERPSVAKAKKAAATMKRRPAKIAEFYRNFVETRSVIDLRMGFLSMQYGVLLRWDTGRTGMVTLIVLRKMCHESFYPKKSPTRIPLKKRAGGIGARIGGNGILAGRILPPLMKAKRVGSAGETCEKEASGGNDDAQKHAVLLRSGGMEVALLEPPYRIPRPLVCKASVLIVSLVYVVGLNSRSDWTVQLAHGGESEDILLTLDEKQGYYTPKVGDPLKHYLPNHTVSALEVKLYEDIIRRRSHKRLAAAMKVPLTSVYPKPHTDAQPTRIRIPLQLDRDQVAIQLEVLYMSDYAHWVSREADARRQESTSGFIWRAPMRLKNIIQNHQHLQIHPETEDIRIDPWMQWLCCVF